MTVNTSVQLQPSLPSLYWLLCFSNLFPAMLSAFNQAEPVPEGVIATNDPDEQEKIIKYGDLVANAVIFHNVVDLTELLLQLKREGVFWEKEDLVALSPYLTSQIKRFGD